jgi:hypothetical protein
VDNVGWNIIKGKITERMIMTPDQAWAINGLNKPPKRPAKGTVPYPISGFSKAGRWQPAEQAQAPMVEKIRKANGPQ